MKTRCVPMVDGLTGLSNCCHAACSVDEFGVNYCKACYEQVALVSTTDTELAPSINAWLHGHMTTADLAALQKRKGF